MSTGRNDHIANGGHAVCLYGDDIPEIKKTVGKIHDRLFVDNGKDSFQTMLVNGAARMADHDREIASLRNQITAHEERPKKILGFCAVVLPLVITVGGAIYWVACWVVDHFQWRAP
jgi:hypothetical protein